MTPEQCAENNLEVFMEQGPGLSTQYLTFIVARDRAKKRVLVGGLGGMGVGEMWFNDDPHFAAKPGYENAPDADVAEG